MSRRTGLSAHTLRFYEKEGLLIEPVHLDDAGRRTFSEREIGWLGVCRALRTTGMPLADIRRYVLAVREGSHTVNERYSILQRHETRVRTQLAELQKALGTIEEKVDVYGRRVADGTADRPWLTGGTCGTPQRTSRPAEEAHEGTPVSSPSHRGAVPLLQRAGQRIEDPGGAASAPSSGDS